MRVGGVWLLGMQGDIRGDYDCVCYLYAGVWENMECVHTMRQIDEVKYLWAYVGVCTPSWNGKFQLYSAP